MRIAILGSNSQIAKDLIIYFSKLTTDELCLYSRRPDQMQLWVNKENLNSCTVCEYDHFGGNADIKFDAIINFVGSGNPATTAAIGASIMQITEKYDNLAIEYLVRNPSCKYLFLSSGAALGSNYMSPVDEGSVATFPLNNLLPQDWYGVAKFYAECKHRSLVDLPIVDVRIFNYFSSSQDIQARFFITDILRAVKTGSVLETSADEIVRDFITPPDLFQLINKILNAPNFNISIDCYSKSPVKKSELLESMAKKFGLNYRITAGEVTINATGAKPNYFSKNSRAAKYFQYVPSLTALDGVLAEADLILRD